ncbi:carbohydrate ABC transporter permease [Ruania zhangjianzhongii]|uniref:carbohydrate ABC transporter permease n=1 Tax=Ruania zhangjianzhongii TaxID=2603206 RepID=UPI001C9E958E|nr:sugar ABC transporter permease [Ruania zhangjianzhongii]
MSAAKTAVAGASGPATRRRRLGRAELAGWVFIAPLMLGILAFQLVPIVVSIVASFTDWDGITTPQFIGAENYTGLAQDDLFWTTLRNTVLFTLGVIPLTTVGALLLAVLCQGKSRVSNVVFRTAYFTPYVTSIVAIGLVWGKLLAPSGFFNSVLGVVGIEGPNWLTDANWALPAVIVISAWQGIGYPMIILLGGLQGIDGSIEEAARIDGAGSGRRFFSITLPLLTPQLFFVLVTQFITSFQVFALIFVLTSGGPGNATNVYIYYLYQNAFTFGRLGYASAMAWILFIIIGAVTFLQLRLQKRWVFYN